jgi:hypothetical protein
MSRSGGSAKATNAASLGERPGENAKLKKKPRRGGGAGKSSPGEIKES